MGDTEMAMAPSTLGLRLLSLDGGGVRGLSVLLTLQTLMYRIQVEKGLETAPLPCDCFDLIGGTSTGGIIAILLGRLRMSVEEAIQCYDDLSGKTFRKSNLLGDGKYSASSLEKVIKTIVKDRTGDSEASLLDDGALGGKCRTFVCSMNAYNMDARKPVLFRSYLSPKQVPIPCTIWQAARATSAAPTFFERILIGPASRPEPFIDGGLGRNNPAEEVLSEARLIFPGRTVASLVSIGTGQSDTIQVPTPGVFASNAVPLGLVNAMVEMATDCEEMAERMEKRFENQPKTYFRFNVDRGLQTVKLDDWDRMDEVSAHTRQYMAKHEVDKRLDDAVRAMLERNPRNLVSISNNALVTDEERGPILDWISPINVFLKHSDVLRTLQPGTGEWLLRTEAFTAWLFGKGKVLWLPGIPGAGKTVLVSLIIEQLRNIQRNQQPTRTGLAWVYYNYKEESTQTPHAIFLSLTRQLTDSSVDLYKHFKSAHKRNPHNCPSLSELLSDGILMRGFERAFIVVDALDECAEENRDGFLRMMSRLQESGANIIITGRDHVSEYVATSALVDIQQIQICARPEDITKYVLAYMEEQTRLASVLRKQPSLRDEIVSLIAKSCQGMFLMAALQMQSLRKHTNVSSLRRALGGLPTTIHEIYDEAMHRIETDDRSDDALRVLLYIFHARRPLMLEELQHFLAVQAGNPYLDNDYITDGDTLVSMCAGLVALDDDTNIIRLVHFSTQEYLDQRRETQFPFGDQEMGRKCLAYLCLDMVRNFDWSSAVRKGHWNRVTMDWNYYWTSADVSEIVSCHVLLGYIVEYWHFHVLPHQDTLREFLLSNPNFGAKDQCGETSLIHASRGGYESAVNFLLDHNVDVNARAGGKKITGLKNIPTGNHTVVEQLLENGANSDAQDKDGTSALRCASLRGKCAVAELLLEHGANIEGQGEDGWTALIWASYKGHRAVVKLLLERGANIEAQAENGWTTLMYASKEGHSAMVERLLERGAMIDTHEKDGTTALIYASTEGHSAVVELLLERGANIEARGQDGSTALMWASDWGHRAVVELLLERGANIDTHEKEGTTALIYASTEGHSALVELLLERGANIEARNHDGRTALMWASYKGHRTVVELLLKGGAHNDTRGETALMWASEQGREELLLERGVNINAQDKYGATALMCASYKGHRTVVELLLERGANVDVHEKDGTTALMWASVEGHIAVVELLLERGANAEAQNGNGKTALMLAEEGALPNDSEAASSEKETNSQEEPVWKKETKRRRREERRQAYASIIKLLTVRESIRRQ